MLNFRKKAAGSSSKTSRRSALNYYRSTKVPAKSPFQRAKKSPKRRLFSRFLDWLIVIALLAALIYGLMLRPSPKLVLSSSAYRPAESYQKAAEAALKNLKNRNKLTFDGDGLAASLKKQFPEIDSVTADLPLFGQSPTILIGIAQPALVLKTTTSQQLIIDSKGVVIGQASGFQSVKDLPLVSDESGFAVRIGEAVLSQSEVEFINTIVAQVKHAKVPIASLTLPKLAQQIDLRTSDRNYYVKFYLGGDAITQSGQFLAARKQFDQTNKQPNEYLDVRVSGKVYFK